MSAPDAAQGGAESEADGERARASALMTPPRPGGGGGARRSREAIGLAFVAAMGMAIATPWLAYLGNLGFAPFMAAAGVLSLPVFLKGRRPPAGVWCILALLVWALASYAWSPLAPGAGSFRNLRQLGRITGLKLILEFALYGAFVANVARLGPGLSRLAGQTLAVGLAVLSALVLVDGLTQAAIYQHLRDALMQHARPDLAIRDVSRAGFVLTVLFWPTVLVLTRSGRPIAAFAFAVCVIADVLVFRTDAAALSLAASTVVAGLIRRFGPAGTWLLVAGVVALFAATPLVVMMVPHAALADMAHASVSKASWGERLKIWTFVLRLIEVRPFQGWGLDASRAWPGLIPLHPHNVALQLWLELGAPGVALAALFWCAVSRRVAELAREDRVYGAVCGAAAAAYVADGAVGFGVWQDWWLALGALGAAYCVLVRVWPKLERRTRALQPL